MPWYVNSLFGQVAAAQDDRLLRSGTSTCWSPWARWPCRSSWAATWARSSACPTTAGRSASVLFSLLASVAVLLLGPPLKLGVDLSGGVILVYEVDQTKKKPGQTVDMDKLIDADQAAREPRRTEGSDDPHVRRRAGRDHHSREVDEAEVQRIERIISQHGQPRVPHPGEQSRQQGAHRARHGRALEDADSTMPTGKLLAWWVPVKEAEEAAVFASYRDIARRTAEEGRQRNHRSPRRQRHLQRHRRLPDAGRRRHRPARGSRA